VARHDPRAALDGGADGLAAYRRIVRGLPGLLNPSGVAILELGMGQSDAVSAMARQAGLAPSARPDLRGIPRALVLRRHSP
jgi:release factor glutamine methyltransferase